MSEDMIPIVLFVVTGLVYIAYFHFNHKNRQSIMQTVQNAIDKGSELTPEMLSQMGMAFDPRIRDLRRGIVLLSLGIAGLLCSFFFNIPEVVNGIRAGSVFPLLLGGGFLLVWKLNSD